MKMRCDFRCCRRYCCCHCFRATCCGWRCAFRLSALGTRSHKLLLALEIWSFNGQGEAPFRSRSALREPFGASARRRSRVLSAVGRGGGGGAASFCFGRALLRRLGLVDGSRGSRRWFVHDVLDRWKHFGAFIFLARHRPGLLCDRGRRLVHRRGGALVDAGVEPVDCNRRDSRRRSCCRNAG